MNSTNNNSGINFTDYVFHNHEWWLDYAGSTQWSDAIGIFIMPVIVVLGIILNFIGLLVLQFGAVFKQAKIYKYLKFCFLNGFICNLAGILYPFTNTRRYLQFSDSWIAMWYLNSLAEPLANACYFYNLIIDTLITFEKLSIFVKRIELINKKYFTRPNRLASLLFLVCLAIDLPFFFIYEASAQLVYLSPNETYEFVNYQISNFGQSNAGQVIIYIQYAIRDVIPLACLVSLNIALIYELRKFTIKKTNLIGAHLTPSPTHTPITIYNRTSRNSLTTQKLHVSTSIMVILICFFALAKSLIMVTAIVYSFVQTGLVANLVGTYSDYFIYTCTTLNFFIICKFDRNFNEFFTQLKCCPRFNKPTGSTTIGLTNLN